MPTAALTSVVPSATSFSSCSDPRGTSASTTAPTIGTNTAAVSAQSWNPFICLPSLEPCSLEEDQRQGERRGGREEHGRVLLDAAGLDRAQQPAALLRRQPHPVDRAVDDALIDHVVDREAEPARGDAGPVDDRIDHVLVHPVRA